MFTDALLKDGMTKKKGVIFIPPELGVLSLAVSPWSDGDEL
jgi:hypothetical protein